MLYNNNDFTIHLNIFLFFDIFIYNYKTYMNEEYIKLVIKQIQNGMNEDQALDIIKELIKNKGEKPKDIWTLNEKHEQSYWYTTSANTKQTWAETVTMLDMENL